MKNEKGSTLLLVLVIILVITTLGMVLSSTALSTRMQFNKTDRLNVATDLAEMGITYLDQKIDQITSAANKVAKEETNKYRDKTTGETVDDVLNEYSRLFCVELSKTELNLPKENYMKLYEIESGKTFEITKLFDQIGANECQSKDEIPLKFISKGSDGSDSKTIEVVAYLTKNRGQGGGSPGSGGGSNEPSPAPPNIESFPIKLFEPISGTNIDKTYPNSVYFEKNVSLNGSSDVTINGDAFFDGHVEVTGSSKLIINGDAYFDSEINFPDQSIHLQGSPYLKVTGVAIFKNKIDFTGNGYDVCITHPFLIVGNNLVIYDIPGNEQCYKPLPQNTEIDMDWTSEDKEIDVTY